MRILAGSLIIAMLATGPALAQGNLLDQGRGLLNTLPGGGGGAAGARGAQLSPAEIGSGLKEALRVGSERVVGFVGKPDGFLKNQEIHIPLPESLQRVQSALRSVGASGMADDLEMRLNRAAEVATPKAKELFWKAINDMTLDDARAILNGPKDAATQYLKGKMSNPLEAAMKPIVDDSLKSAGAVQAYDSMMGRYKAIPFMPDARADLTDHVLDKAMAALFMLLGREEAAIRDNPAQRSTELLRKVFGA